jgi:hypothetical protein
MKHLLYTTTEGVQIFCLPGKKKESKYDFIIKYKEPNKRERTPKHIHLIVEMYVKYAHNPQLTMKLRDYFISIFDSIKPVNTYPPKLQVFNKNKIKEFADLNKVGEFSVEFLMVVTELILIQEKTNYPKGSLTRKLYTDFGIKDRFAVISQATQTRFG